MAFVYEVGQAVVFGTSGATTIRAIKTRDDAGRTWTRVTLGFPFDSADPDTILEPLADHDCLAPLSRVLGSGGVPAVLEVLAGPVPDREPRVWGVVMADGEVAPTVHDTYLTMIGGITADADLDGMPAVLDARLVAEVVRNLTARRYREPLDAGYSQLLDQALLVLVSEVALGAGIGRAQAEATIDEALSVHRPAS